MMFSKLDLITPKISLFFKGKKTHSSVFSGILTLISYIIILIISVYFSLDLIKRQNPGVYFLNRFIEDAGFFPLNSSSMFHFFQFTLEDNSIDIVDFNAITIVGLEQYIGTYTADNNLNELCYYAISETTRIMLKNFVCETYGWQSDLYKRVGLKLKQEQRNRVIGHDVTFEEYIQRYDSVISTIDEYMEANPIQNNEDEFGL